MSANLSVSKFCTSLRPIGYRTPVDAQKGPREQILYVTCLPAAGNPSQSLDYVATVDVDPDSRDYEKVVRRAYSLQPNQEYHHSGWNACSSCINPERRCRNKLIIPCLSSDCIYVYQVDPNDERNLLLFKVIDNLFEYDLSAPHTVHCSPDGHVLISCMGNAKGQAKGTIIQLDGCSCEIKKIWSQDFSDYGYAFWYKPSFNVLISTEWGAPNAWRRGFREPDLVSNQYGSSISVFNFSNGRRTQLLQLGNQGMVPLEVKFMHEPNQEHGYIVCALGGSIFHICREKTKTGQPVLYVDEDEIDTQGSTESTHSNQTMFKWTANLVIQLESVQVLGFNQSELKPVLTDFIISMDDKWMYVSNWTHGEVLQYSLQKPHQPELISKVNCGGMIRRGEFNLLATDKLKVENEEEEKEEENLLDRPRVRGQPLRGGPQMLQLSLDGKRLYVCNSLHSKWDQQFHPDVYYQGSQMYLLNTGIPTSSSNEMRQMQLEKDFLVDFGKENPPALAHEARYPGGDCTSDIW